MGAGRRGRWAESAGNDPAAAYTAPMARMLYLRDIDVDVHVRCCACGHQGVLPRDVLHRRFGPNYPVLSIAPHYRCSRCDSRDVESRPAPPRLSLVETEPADLRTGEDAFAGPLAALQGLLDAVRTRGDEPEKDESTAKDDAGSVEAEPVRAPDPPTEPARAAFFPPEEANEPPPPPMPKPAAKPATVPAPQWLEDLVADEAGDDNPVHPPLWEPMSLADIAARLSAESLLDEDEDGGEAGWAEGPESAEPVETAAEAPPEAEAETDDGGDRGFDLTIAALRRMLEREEETPAPDAGEAAWDAVEDEARAENHEEEEEEEEDAPPLVFSPKALVRSDFEEDDAALHHEPPADEDDEDEGGDEDGDEELEPSDEDILTFAIRDPEKTPPAPPRPRPPWDSLREPDDTPLDKTIAALRAMVTEAAAEPEEEDRPVRPMRATVVEPEQEEEEEDEDDLPVTPEPQDPAPEDEPPAFRAVPQAGPRAVSWFDEGAAAKDEDSDEEEEAPEPPRTRKSAQELEMEEALLALRALVEADDDEDEDDRGHPGRWKKRPGDPAHSDLAHSDSGHSDPDAALHALLHGDPLGRDKHDDEPPLDLVDEVMDEATDDETPPEKGKGGGKGAGNRNEGNQSEGSALEKTIAALRGMLELDGKRGR